MTAVETVRVSDVAELRRVPVEVEPAGLYREIGLRSFGKGVFHKEPVSGATLGTKRVFEIHPGDLILSNVFAWEGAIAVAGEDEEGRIGSHRFMTYVVDPERADASYLRHFFLSETGLELIRRASPGSAGRNRTLGIDAFEALRIPLPPVQEQRCAAARLDHLSVTASEIRNRVTYAERVIAAIPPSLAQRRDLSDDEKRERGWRHTPLGDVMSLVRDAVTVDVDAIYPNVGILNVGRGLFEKPPIEGARTSATTLYRIAAGQFIYSRLFAFEGAYAAVPPELDGRYVSNEFPTFDVDDAVADASFLAAYLRSPETWADLARSSTGLGNRRQRVHPEAILAFTVWLPPRAVQQSVVDQLAQLSGMGGLRARFRDHVDAVEASALNDLVVPAELTV